MESIALKLLIFKMGSLGALALLLAVVIWSLLKKSRDNRSPIDLDDLLLERGHDGRKQISKVAVITFSSFIATTWVLIYQTIAGSLDAGIFTGYLAVWAAPLIAKIIKGNGAPASLPTEKKDEPTSKSE